MELAFTVAQQVIIVFILIGVGYILRKKNIIDRTGVKQLTDILLIAVTPCVIIKAYYVEFNISRAYSLMIAVLFTVIIHIAAVIISKLIFPAKPDDKKYRVSRFAAICSNCGFMAIPLLSAALGDEGVFYGCAYLVVFTVFYWTYGVYICTGDKKAFLSFRQAFVNPGVIGVAIGLFLFFTRIPLPDTVVSSISYIASLNTPVAMIILGAFLVNVDIKKALKNKELYLVCFVRLILIPFTGLFIAKIMNISPMLAQTVMIGAACPSATVTALFAEKYELDTGYASEIVSVSTILSVITVPLMVYLCTVAVR